MIACRSHFRKNHLLFIWAYAQVGHNVQLEHDVQFRYNVHLEHNVQLEHNAQFGHKWSCEFIAKFLKLFWSLILEAKGVVYVNVRQCTRSLPLSYCKPKKIHHIKYFRNMYFL